MTKTILERLKTLLLDQYNIDVGSIKPEAPIESIGLDSLDMVDFFYAIEQEFKIKLPTPNLNLKSIQDLVDLVERTVKEQTPQEPLNRTTE
jgi:acyl carrier protein